MPFFKFIEFVLPKLFKMVQLWFLKELIWSTVKYWDTSGGEWCKKICSFFSRCHFVWVSAIYCRFRTLSKRVLATFFTRRTTVSLRSSRVYILLLDLDVVTLDLRIEIPERTRKKGYFFDILSKNFFKKYVWPPFLWKKASKRALWLGLQFQK